ncbi:MAG: DUF2062 domain-containing protein [Phycisphaerales bacterium]|jgi:uncharacterized protein|nr:DUF2062 domain-containing protein [Phycisphaerales bacterium]
MPHRYIAKKIKAFFIYRVLHIDDTPHRIALGVGIGMFITWTPTVGFQMLLVLALAWLLGANKLVGVPFVWISNPVTIAPIFYPNYLLGKYVLGSNCEDPNFTEAITLSGTWLEKVQNWWEVTWRVFWPLWVGSIIIGLVLGVISYGLIYYSVIEYRKIRHRHDQPKPEEPT